MVTFMTLREKRIANAVARLASSYKRRPNQDLARAIEYILSDTKSFEVEVVIKALDSFHGSRRFPDTRDIEKVCEQIEAKKKGSR